MTSPKGGAGKSTATISLAGAISKKATVCIIDADPNFPIDRWKEMGGNVENITITKNIDEHDLVDQIEDARKKFKFVIIDLEGSANLRTAYAVAYSDLVLIPTQPSTLDADQAAKAVRLIKAESKKMGKHIPYRVLFTRIPNYKTRTYKHLEDQLDSANIPYMKTHIRDLEAFRAIFSFSQTFDQMDEKQVPNIKAAQKNTLEFAKEVITILKTERTKKEK